MLKIYSVLLMIDAILSYFPESQKWPIRQKLKKICDWSCDPIRKKLPAHLPFDLSPIVVIFLIYLLIALW
jgi:uncharacterized protein YggT (Ycf19 family)